MLTWTYILFEHMMPDLSCCVPIMTCYAHRTVTQKACVEWCCLVLSSRVLLKGQYRKMDVVREHVFFRRSSKRKNHMISTLTKKKIRKKEHGGFLFYCKYRLINVGDFDWTIRLRQERINISVTLSTLTVPGNAVLLVRGFISKLGFFAEAIL